MTDAPDDLIAVGRIGPPRGVKGELFVEPWTDSPDERFASGATLHTEPAAAGPLVVAAASHAGGKQVVRFDGVDDRAAAEGLRGVRLFVRADDRPDLDDPDEFYDSDLVGLTARTVAGEELGPVTDVVHAAGTSYLVLGLGDGERLVPFVTAIVPTVDLAAGTVTVNPPDGLFDL